jgi:hypothetical protein
MNLIESLKLERYKLVTERQKYFTELARDAFASYVRFLTGLTAGAITLVSTRNKLELRPPVVLFLVDAILYLVWFLAVVTSGQIVFCLVRWYGFRKAEARINPDSPPPDWWWWVFETLYVIVIVFSAIVAWRVARQLPGLLG